MLTVVSALVPVGTVTKIRSSPSTSTYTPQSNKSDNAPPPSSLMPTVSSSNAYTRTCVCVIQLGATTYQSCTRGRADAGRNSEHQQNQAERLRNSLRLGKGNFNAMLTKESIFFFKEHPAPQDPPSFPTPPFPN